jgi:addiction module HigA family antidote
MTAAEAQVLKTRLDPDCAPSHPGEILREDILPRLAVSRAELARHLEMSDRGLAEILAERGPVTFDIAQRLGAALGTGTRYWLALQAQYDLWRASEVEPPRIEPVAWRRKRATTASHVQPAALGR